MPVIKPLTHAITNPRIDGLKILSRVLENTDFDLIGIPDSKIISKEIFSNYLKNGNFSPEDKVDILSSARELLAIATSKSLAIRRAFYIPDFPDPPGPRFLGVKSPEEFLADIRTLFDFAITHKYHQRKGAVIEAFFYPFNDPPPVSLPINNNTVLPRGGCAFATSNSGDTIKIMAVFGNNEGVQSLSRLDEYLVDSKNMIIVEKIIPQKLEAICTTGKAQDDIVRLPLNFQFRQVLSDLEILELVLFLKNMIALKKMPMRIEFSAEGKKLYVNEAIRYEAEAKQEIVSEMQGVITVIEQPADLIKIRKDNSGQIIYISKAVVKDRNYDLLNALAGVKHRLTILYPGTSATAHAMRVLVDKGHTAFVAGNQTYQDNDQVEITNDGKQIVIRKIPEKSGELPVYSLAEADKQNRLTVGSKAFNLGKLLSLGYQVPAGYVISSDISGREDFFTSADFLNLLKNLSDKDLYSVRSSADVEDSSFNAFAGQFASYLHVSKDKIAENVKAVWASAKTPHVKKLLEDLEMQAAHMAVIIQKMIQPQYSGVIFGANPETKNTNQAVIEIVQDYAEKVVDGTGRIRKIIFDKFERKIIFDNREKTVKISEEILQILFQMYMKLEENFNNIQDVEWTIDKENELYLLQTRDLIV